ncbi:T-cell immunoglobulin and mucin domain-containing protein 4-like [Epinephelus fuscoguttatus]|uniref:T-cell immunoglobulin and mucin domain-containing protein 4-like n=1 Tax=Epinephelus fuscoguttatus TaxID=293821 RepID=UPI0020D0995A|nr:T-cell immunoglobulin and mucin domain-containing protein 4-like [Epinephelus fuscoguttatus]
MMKLVLLLTLLTVSEGDGSRVVGQLHGNVTLPCTYNIKYYGALTVCWGRGEIPNSGCKKQLISTDGQKVTEGSRVPSRYQLLGRLDEGDVSLTILNVSELDAGRYGCRVAVPGPFNDLKHHIDLTVEEAPLTTTSTTLNTETSPEQTTDEDVTGHVNSTDRPLTSSSSSIVAKESSGTNVVLLCVLFGLVALVTAGAVLIIASRRRRLNKTPEQQQQVVSSVQYSATSSSLQLQSRSLAVENIYQIEGGLDGSEYEYCP